MKYFFLVSLFLSICFVTLIHTSSRGQKFQFIREKEGILLKHNEDKIFFYQSVTKSVEGNYPRSNYIHPLYGLNGEILTEDFPEDHLHHRGVFWAWHQFIVRNQKAGDPWECRDVSWVVESAETETYEDSAALNVTVYWTGKLPGDSGDEVGKLLKEDTRITTKILSGNQREISFNIQLTALYEGTAIGGSEDHKGYSGFSIRTKLPEDLKFYSSTGIVKPIETAIDAGGWIDMRGTFDPSRDQQTNITIMCNPEDPQPFHGWILRDRGSMQNAAFPGPDPVKIQRGKTLRMEYKLFLHSPEISSERINQVYENFIR